MFEIKPYKTIIRDLHKIENNFLSLFNDGDNDVLYTGTNKYGNRILGVIMFEDDEKGLLRYSHLLITDSQYVDFINRNISLRAIFDECEGLFLVDKNLSGEEVDANIVTIADIPASLLPLNSSYCPNFIKDPSFSYAVGLKGRKADLNLTEPEDLNNVNTHFTALLKSATEVFSRFNIGRHIYVEALPAGSFRIKFRIEVSQNSQDLFKVPISEVSLFLNEYLSYLFEKLPREDSNIFKGEESKSSEFIHLETLLSNMFKSSIQVPGDGVEQILIDSMSYSIENLKQIDYGGSFEKIELINYSSTGSEMPIALIDKEYIPAVENKFFKIEKVEDRIDYDSIPQKYFIQVYALNKETGNGLAYLHYNQGVYKVSLHLRGKDNYQNTIFTHNMDEQDPKLIEILAIGKRVNDTVRELTYTYT